MQSKQHNKTQLERALKIEIETKTIKCTFNIRKSVFVPQY